MARQSFIQAALVVGIHSEFLPLFHQLLGGLNQPFLVLIEPEEGPTDGDDPQKEQPADDRKDDCQCFGHGTSSDIHPPSHTKDHEDEINPWCLFVWLCGWNFNYEPAILNSSIC